MQKHKIAENQQITGRGTVYGRFSSRFIVRTALISILCKGCQFARTPYKGWIFNMNRRLKNTHNFVLLQLYTEKPIIYTYIHLKGRKENLF